MFHFCFLEICISKEHNGKKPGELEFQIRVLTQILTEGRQDTNRFLLGQL